MCGNGDDVMLMVLMEEECGENAGGGIIWE